MARFQLQLWGVVLCLGVAAPAAAQHGPGCEKMTVSIEFLGWTRDGSAYAWQERQKTPLIDSVKISVGSTVTTTENVEFVTNQDAGAKAWAAWRGKHPLVKVSASPTSPVDATASLTAKLSSSSQAVTGKGNEFVPDPKGTEPVALELSVKSKEVTDGRYWAGDRGVCGTARGYWSPDGRFVLWLTGPATHVCGSSECKPEIICCKKATAWVQRVK